MTPIKAGAITVFVLGDLAGSYGISTLFGGEPTYKTTSTVATTVYISELENYFVNISDDKKIMMFDEIEFTKQDIY